MTDDDSGPDYDIQTPAEFRAALGTLVNHALHRGIDPVEVVRSLAVTAGGVARGTTDEDPDGTRDEQDGNPHRLDDDRRLE